MDDFEVCSLIGCMHTQQVYDMVFPWLSCQVQRWQINETKILVFAIYFQIFFFAN